MNILRSLSFCGLIFFTTTLSSIAQSSTTAKGSTVTFTMNTPENFTKEQTLSKADSLALVKQAKATAKLAAAQTADSIKKVKAAQKALLAKEADSLKKLQTQEKLLAKQSAKSSKSDINKAIFVEPEIAMPTTGAIITSAAGTVATVDMTPPDREVPTMTDKEIQRKISSLKKATDTEEVKQKDIPVKDSVYNKILGVKFKKSVDYASKVNTFEDEDNYALLEKGASFISMNLGLASFKLDDKWIEPLVKIDDTYYTQLFVKASGGYFIANNTAAALKLSYGFYDNRIKLSSDILQLLINSKTYETNNVGTDVAVSAVIRNYIPIGFQQRFFLVTETALGYKYSESLQRNIYDNGVKISKIQTYSHMGTLGISPGVTYFMTKGFAFEFMLSPIQIYYQNSRSINDEVANGSTQSYGLTFAFTPLNIQLGFSYYFGLDYKKNHDYMSKYYNKVRR